MHEMALGDGGCRCCSSAHMGRIQTCMQVVEGQASQLVTGILQKPVYRVFLPMRTARVPCACATGPASMSPSLPESSCAESGDFQAGTRWNLKRDHLHLVKLIHFGSLSLSEYIFVCKTRGAWRMYNWARVGAGSSSLLNATIPGTGPVCACGVSCVECGADRFTSAYFCSS